MQGACHANLGESVVAVPRTAGSVCNVFINIILLSYRLTMVDEGIEKQNLPNASANNPARLYSRMYAVPPSSC